MEDLYKKIGYNLINNKYIFELIYILIGTAIMAMGTALFLLPNRLSSGGFTGIATITYYLFNWKMGYVIILLNIPFFIIAFIKIGKEFVVRTIIGTVSLSYFLNIFERIQPLTSDKFLSCIYGGILIGVGSSIILKVSASTGGSDLVCYIIKSFKPGLSTSNIIVIFDAIVVALNVIVFKELEIGLYSAISIYLMGKIIDIVFEGIDFSKMMFIISDNYVKISNKIEEEIKRGTTGICAKGMYTNDEKTMLMCIASRREVIRIRQIATVVDPKVFIVITNAREVYGKGFKK